MESSNKVRQVSIIGNITSAPVRVAWIIGNQTLTSEYQQTVVLPKPEAKAQSACR